VPTTRRVLRGVALVGALALVSVSLTTTPALASSPDIVISQVYGGGGNSGAQYTNDFIELYNRGAAAVSVTGWTVQYASAAGSTWSKTALSGSIAAGSHYLVKESSGGTAGAALPTPEATGTISMSASAGKVALVTNATALTCSVGCSTAAGVKDFIGYGGTASSYETAPAPGLSNTTADQRLGAGATDTDNNAADFGAAAPDPRNSSGGTGGTTRIHDIQGATHLSPYNGKAVSAIPGIVTAVAATGFYLQDPIPDADPATSEGIYVAMGAATGRTVGDSITVSGTVSEVRPGNTATNLTTTEITAPSVTLVSAGNTLPATTLVGAGGRVPPSTVIKNNTTTGDAETSGAFDPTTQGLDFWESMEGMRVQLNDAAVVGPRNQYGEVPVAPAGSTTRTPRGGILLQPGDANPERVVLDDILAPTPVVNVGDTLTGATVGVLSYGFGDFMLEVTATPAVTSGGITPEVTATPTATQLSVATFNVENLAPSDPATKYSRLAGIIVGNLKSPDLIAVEEVQDNSGATNDGVVAADVTLTQLVNAIGAAGGPAYTWREIDPVNDQDGGQPGGNIRQVFLFRTDRGLSFVDKPGGTSTVGTTVTNVGGTPQLTYSPGRITPTNSAWSTSRKPLAGQFLWNGHPVFVIANHFNSKGGDQPLFGHFQPPSAPSETQRHAQATQVKTFVDQILAIDPSADIVVLGDLNDFEYSQTAQILTTGGSLVDLPLTLPLTERYTYVYEGNSQVLDQILVSHALAGTAYAYDIVHVNSEFADQASDHEPQVVRIPLP
jgi:predicted extracellular nuclease